MNLKPHLVGASFLALTNTGFSAYVAADSVTAGMLEEVVVTAQRREQNILDVPISVTSVSSQVLSFAGVDDTLSIEQVVPGLQMEVVGAYLQPNLRGVSTTVVGPGFDANIAMYVDGVYQSAMAGNIFDLPVVDRVEVLKGPQGTLFGRNATGGAIQIFTKQPTYEMSGHIGVRGGKYSGGEGQYGATGYVTGALFKDKVAGSLAVKTLDDDGYIENVFLDRKLGKKNSSANVKLRIDPIENLRIDVGASYSMRDDYTALALEALDGNLQARAIDSSIVSPSERYSVSQDLLGRVEGENYGANFKIEYDTSIGAWSWLSAYGRSESSRNDADSDASSIVVAHYINPVEAKTVSNELIFSSEQFGDFSFISGIYLFRDTQEWSPFTVVDVITYQAKNETEVRAIFAELTYQLTDKLSVIGGLRYSDENRTGYVSTAPFPGGKPVGYDELGEKTWTSTTPRASLIYSLNDNSNIYFTYSEGFKSGGFDTLNFNPVAINPETLNSYEVGYKMSAETYSLNVAAYYYDYKDQQVGTYKGLVLSTQNAASSIIKGIDLDGRWRPNGGNLELQGGLSYLPTAKFDTWNGADALVPAVDSITGEPCRCGNIAVAIDDASGYRITRTPKLTASVSASYDMNMWGGLLNFSGNVYYSSGYNAELTGRIEQDSYALLNGEVSWELDRWRVSLWGRNLGNETDVIGVNQIGTLGDTFTYSAPRLVGVGLDYRF